MTLTDTARRRPLITLLVVCQSTIGLIFGGIGLFLPLIRTDLGLSFTEAGTLAAASNLTYALMQVPSGYLADRFTPRRLFLIGLLGLNVLSALFAVLDTYPLLLIDQALAGFFRALVFTPGMLLMTRLFPPGRRATAMGLYVVGGFSSNVLLSAVGPLGWRLLFLLFSGFGLLALALYRFLAGPAPRREPGDPVRFADLPGLIRQRIIQLTGVIQFTRLAVAQGFTFWLPTYLVVDRGQSLATAGLVAALASAISAPVNYLGGYLSDRINRPLLVIGGSLTVLTAGLTLLTYVPGMLGVLGVVALISMAIQVYFGPLFALPLQVLGSSGAGLISGFGNFCANLGSFAFVYALGAVKDATGSFRAGFLSLAALCVVALIATRLTRPLLRRAG
ncbi:putative MFS family arabinose efflux permease [Actinoplanes campanulatus]|uniref:Putative MFS family arabinose efflux permease n=1 Tax=Actinoplanes campanulatus TaxID=113559 RepID=A0A7W5FD33_9ACTN|nr:MFS transporter [Actinoplanes campanulatus]MBB3093912.1 putative MFS family arabinose efflux permease [Actinoplanes campanulatus]GGN33785.1 MFS transporter [Actinoplanes campanulatus]GID38392.1 MFS transporter [Actinoplanes campanulatus]